MTHMWFNSSTESFGAHHSLRADAGQHRDGEERGSRTGATTVRDDVQYPPRLFGRVERQQHALTRVGAVDGVGSVVEVEDGGACRLI